MKETSLKNVHMELYPKSDRTACIQPVIITHHMPRYDTVDTFLSFYETPSYHSKCISKYEAYDKNIRHQGSNTQIGLDSTSMTHYICTERVGIGAFPSMFFLTFTLCSLWMTSQSTLLLLFYCYHYLMVALQNFSLFDLSHSQVPHIDDIPICLKLHNTVSLSNTHVLSIQTKIRIQRY